MINVTILSFLDVYFCIIREDDCVVEVVIKPPFWPRYFTITLTGSNPQTGSDRWSFCDRK